MNLKAKPHKQSFGSRGLKWRMGFESVPICLWGVWLQQLNVLASYCGKIRYSWDEKCYSTKTSLAVTIASKFVIANVVLHMMT